MSNLTSSANKAQMIELLNSIKLPIMGAGGGFASIGAECYHEGTIAPEGWLICDGSVLNIADYPELATYYASHYGASNHFGGDGVTTFAVPTKEGMPNSADSVYGEEEHIVGVYKQTVDGVLKQKPVYEKTVVISPLTIDSNWHAVPHGISNIDIVYYFEGVVLDGNGVSASVNSYRPTSSTGCLVDVSRSTIDYINNRITSAITMYVTLRYTKTTDQWTLPTPGHSADGNGVFCVKATLSDANLDAYTVYSPVEHQKGWWREEVDGVLKQKPIYEKTLSVGDLSTGTYNYTHNISNIDRVVSYLGTAMRGDGAQFVFPSINMASSNYNASVYCIYTSSVVVFSVGSGASGNDRFQDCKLTIRYTKTTDDWQVV